tara:strand:- start:3 stop:581 length:579 start_codon:yes stop_codon:yes gene_type:complete
MQKSCMRIISGKYKGIKLNKLGNLKIRPTSDRLKEAVFSIIFSKKYSKSILQKKFLDLCSGSGSIGIEAFSRGAELVYLIDLDYKAIKLSEQNVEQLNLSKNEKNKLIILQGDATKLKNLNLPVFDFVYIDPPYKDNSYYKILSSLIENKIINKETLILIEAEKTIEALNICYYLVSTKKYGNSYINIIKIK